MKTVLYIHGMNSTSKTFNHIISCFPLHEVITVNYNSALPIENSYLYILSKIPKHKPICIVGHSLGGLLGYLIDYRDNCADVTHLVTISAPFHGSPQARVMKWLYPTYQVLSDLSPDSSIMSEIEQSKPKCSMLSLISTRGNNPLIPEQNDGIVTIRSQQATPAKKKIQVAANHFEIIQDSRTVSEINKFIFCS
jgi:hypothetical protein